MKKLNFTSLIVLSITVIIMAVNMLVTPLADWVVRVDGIIMVIALFLTAFSTMRMTSGMK